MGDVQLIEAVKAGNLAMAEALLAAGADIHQQDEQGWTPLNWAAGKGEVALSRASSSTVPMFLPSDVIKERRI